MPELVEKNEQPIINKIKKIKDKLLGIPSRETPTLEILLVKDKNNLLKSLSKLKKIKKINKIDRK